MPLEVSPLTSEPPPPSDGSIPDEALAEDRLERGPLRARALWVAVAVVVAACLGFALASQWSSPPDIEWRFRPGWLALSLLCLLAFQWLHIELWRGMLHSLGGTLPRWKARSIWSTTLLARYVPTSALMAVGRIALSQREGVPRRISTASVLYEVAFTLTAATRSRARPRTSCCSRCRS